MQRRQFFDTRDQGRYSHGAAETGLSERAASLNSIGEQLRQAREAKGLSIQDVEQATHIRRAFLLAIEEERFEDLPEPTYARGFVRQYAQLVGLDAAPVLEAFGRAMGPRQQAIPTVLDEPLWESTRPGLRGLITVLLVALVLLVAGWFVYHYAYLHQTPWPLNRFDLSALRLRTATPQPTATMTAAIAQEPAPTETPLPTATSEPATPTPTTPLPTLTPTPRSAVGGASTTGTPTAEAPSAGTPTVPASEGLPIEEGFVVRLVATGYTWVGVTVDDEQVFAGNLDDGDERSWTVENVFEITIGNAAAVSLDVNGVDVPALGGQGQVVTLRYTPETLPQ
jgi:cytoskeleton protein RodZ